jgi:hypothetical protein
MDSAKLVAGEAWESGLIDAIRSSEFVVAFLSRHTLGGYQEKELRIANDRAPAGRGAAAPFVLPCVVDSEVYSSFADAVPDFLASQHAVRLTDVEEGWRDLHRALCQAARSAALHVPVLLRSDARTDLDHSGATRMIVQTNFFDATRNKGGDAPGSALRSFRDGRLVEDRSTGRIWTRDSAGPLPYAGTPDVHLVVRKANEERFYGLDKWRIPTLEEAMSLMMKDAREGGLHISPLFSNDEYLWTCDSYVDNSTYLPKDTWRWIVCYRFGDCQPVLDDAPARLRLVRHAWDY